MNGKKFIATVEGNAEIIPARRAAKESVTYAAEAALQPRLSERELRTGTRRKSTQLIYVTAWLDFSAFLRYHLGEEPSPTTWMRENGPLHHLKPELMAFLDRVIPQLTVEDLEAYRVAMLNMPTCDKLGKPKVGLSQSTINVRFSALSRLFTIAVRKEKMKENIASSTYIDRPKVGAFGRRTALSLDQVKMLKKSLQRPPQNSIEARDRCLVLFLLHTGLRRAEAARLKWVHIQDNPQGVALNIRRKGDIEASILLSRTAEKELAIYQAYLLKNQIGEYVFPAFVGSDYSRPRGSIHPDALTCLVKIITQRVLGFTVSPHVLRHTFATTALDNGAPLHQVQLYLGHMAPATTMLYYTAILKRETSAAEFVSFE